MFIILFFSYLFYAFILILSNSSSFSSYLAYPSSGRLVSGLYSLTVRLELPDSRLQFFVRLSVNMNPSQGIYGGIGVALVRRQYKIIEHNVNKNPTRCNIMQIFIYRKVTLHVSSVTAPIIRSTKNCNRSLQ